MTHQQPTSPGLRKGAVAEVVTDLGVQPYRSDAAVSLHRKKDVGTAGDDAAMDAECGIVERKLRIGADAEVGWLL